MNKDIKLLVEYIAFNPAVLQDNKPKLKIKLDIISDHLSIIPIEETNILWWDLSVYTLEYIKENKPKGYPIGINVVDDKYVSLKYVDKTGNGSTKEIIDIIFSNKNRNDYPSDIQLHDDLYRDSIKDLLILIKNNFYKLLNSRDLKDEFGNCFNGKQLTLLILNDLTNEDDYPVVYYVNKFNLGKTKKGDWYIPEIGELAKIYIMKPVINYICKELINLGYTDIYPEIKDYWLWSSTFYSSDYVYYISMDFDFVYSSNKNSSRAVLAMLELDNLLKIS